MIKVITPPATELVDFELAKDHLRLSGSDEQTYVERLIKSARGGCQEYINRSIGEQTILLTLDQFKSEISLPMGPVSSVEKVEYLNMSGAKVTFADYHLSEDRLTPAYGFDWPSSLPVNGAVEVTYKGGYTATSGPSLVPDEIISAILLTVADLYENREGQFVGVNATINPTVENLLFPHRTGLGV